MGGKILHFRQLDVWKEAHKLVLMVYEVTKKYPSDERFGLVSQMRRAAVSIPANIAEGFKRVGLRDKARFYNISEGSLEEIKYFFILSKDLVHLIPGLFDGTGRDRRAVAQRPRSQHEKKNEQSIIPTLPTPYSLPIPMEAHT